MIFTIMVDFHFVIGLDGEGRMADFTKGKLVKDK